MNQFYIYICSHISSLLGFYNFKQGGEVYLPEKVTFEQTRKDVQKVVGSLGGGGAG